MAENQAEMLIKIATDDKEIDKTEQKLQKMSSNLETAFSAGSFAGLGAALKKVTSYLGSAVKQSADYIETLNVLDVAFNNNTESIKKFSSQIADTLNLDDSTIIKAAAHFKVLSQSMNIATDTGEKLSKLMTQMTLDLSSLYNMDFNKAQTALQYAMEGRGTSLKQRTGVSVLETSVQTTLDVLGIDAYVKDMNDAEKAIARVIAIEYQLRSSQGDLARTIEAPANQMRVMGEQLSLLARNIGNLFLPAVAAVLPYLNAFLIIVNSIISALAKLVGFSEGMFDLFSGSDVVDNFEDIGTAIGGIGNNADSAAKKLQGLRGFDKLNVIKTPSDSKGGGGAGGGAGGINSDLLEAFNKMADQYKNNLDSIKTKATQIAEAFQEWAKCLDVIKEPLKNIAGLTYDGLKYIWKNVLQPLGKWIADDLIPTAAKTIAAALDLIYAVGKNLFAIYKKIYEIVILPFARSIGNAIISSLETIAGALETISKNKFLTTLVTAVAAFVQLKNVLGLIAKTKIGSYLKTVGSMLLTNVTGVKSLNNIWKNFFEYVKPAKLNKITTQMTGMKKATTLLTNTLKSLKTAALGAVAAFAGFEILKGSFKDISDNGASLGNVLGVVVGTITAVAGALTTLNAITTIFGVTLASLPIVGWIAGLTSVAVALGTIIVANNDFNSTSQFTKDTIEEIETSYDSLNTKLNEVGQSYDTMLDSFNKNYEAKLAEIENGQAYIDSLDEIVDGNFRVKSGYEDVAETILNELNQAYGTELTLEDGVIKNNGQIISDKQQLISITDQYAEKIKKQTLLEGYQALYKNAIEQQIEAKKAYNDTTDETNKKIEETIKKLEKGKITTTEADKILQKAKKEQNKAEEKYQNTLTKTESIVNGLDKVTKTYATGTSEELQNTIGEITKTSEKTQKETEQNLKNSMNNLSFAIKNVKEKNKRALEEMNRNNMINYEMTLDTRKAEDKFNRFASNVNNSGAGMAIRYVPRTYAEGGLPQVGQLFIANERGPELVGSIGGQSFVANQNQVIDLIDRKLQNATGGVNNATFIVQVGNKEIARQVITDLQDMAKDNGKPITINA